MQDDKSLKIKFYLRGLATGLVIAVVLMGIVAAKQTKASENPGKGSETESSEVAKSSDVKESESVESSEVESTEPSESSEVESTESSESSEVESTEPVESSEVESSEIVESSEVESTEPVESSEAESSEIVESSEVESGESEEYVTIVIKRGNSSYTVAKMLEQAGLVANAKSYDAYLSKNGYDKRISVGEFQIKKGSTEEEIAKIITNAK